MRRARTRWEEDNIMPLNLGAVAAVVGLVLFVAGVAVLLALT